MSSVRRTFISNFFLHQCCQHSFHNFSAMRLKSTPHHQHTKTHTNTHTHTHTHTHNTHTHTQKHNTKTQPHHYKKHHDKNKKNITTKTPPHHHKNTTAPPQKHHHKNITTSMFIFHGNSRTFRCAMMLCNGVFMKKLVLFCPFGASAS